MTGQSAAPGAPPAHASPSRWALASEGIRAGGELAGLGATIGLVRRWAPRGDGHPVLVLPGFTASDLSTRPLRAFLRAQGWFVHGWRLGRNVGPTARVVDGLRQRVAAVVAEHGEPISVVGWSLGGIFAREIARSAPQHVRQVITLGSPFDLRDRRRSNAAPLFRALSPFHVDPPPEFGLAEAHRPALAVPATAVFSRGDGVVPWRACVDPHPGRVDNLEVRGSHSGLGHNPAVLWAAADRLAQPSGAWAPFEPTSRWRRLGGVNRLHADEGGAASWLRRPRRPATASGIEEHGAPDGV